jgi:signal transduction histidine kinase
MKFTPRYGRVTLHSENLGDALLVSVEDTGQGISETDLPHIFDRFWKADSAYDQGVGLGLAIAKGIVDAHGGRIWAESRPGQGSIFYFTIPC